MGSLAYGRGRAKMASAGALTASFDGIRARARFSLILSAGAMLLDRLGPPMQCRGCWPHDGEVAGGAVGDLVLVIFRSRRRARPSQLRGQLRHDPIATAG